MKKKTVEARHMPDREIAGTTIEQKWMNFLMLLVGFGMIALGVICLTRHQIRWNYGDSEYR
ncbi:MAG: hypothetical protein ABIG42_11125 [bacterium]